MATCGAVCLMWWDGDPVLSRLSPLTDCLALHLHCHPITHFSYSSALGVESGELWEEGKMVLYPHTIFPCTHIHITLSTLHHPYTHTSSSPPLPSIPHSVGGSLPVAFSYFCEFFTKKNRGAFVIILASFWITGSVFAALVAWAVIPNLPPQGYIGSVQLRSWRVYVMLCTIPCLTAAIALLFMPETPYFLYSVSGTMSSPLPPTSLPPAFLPPSLLQPSLLPPPFPPSIPPSLHSSLFLSLIRKAKSRRL